MHDRSCSLVSNILTSDERCQGTRRVPACCHYTNTPLDKLRALTAAYWTVIRKQLQTHRHYVHQSHAQAAGRKLKHLKKMMIFPNPCIQEVFRDFCDVSGFLPKVKVGDAVRCLGENPLQSEVTHTDTALRSCSHLLCSDCRPDQEIQRTGADLRTV